MLLLFAVLGLSFWQSTLLGLVLFFGGFVYLLKKGVFNGVLKRAAASFLPNRFK